MKSIILNIYAPLFYVLLLATSCSVQKNKKNKIDNRFGFHLKGKKQHYTRVPFELTSNLIVVKVTIDNSDTLNFILDTGVSSTIITDPSIGNKIGLNYVRNVQLSGAGEGIPVSASVSIGHKLTIGEDVIAQKQNIVVINENILDLSAYLGLPVHGIFGHDLFSAFVITIDFENRKLEFINPDKFKARKKHGTIYPIFLTQSKPFTEAFSIVNDGKEKPLKLVIDTGAGHSLMLNPFGDQEIVRLPKKVIRANLGKGLNGEINGHLGRIPKVKIGNLELKEILASFPDSISFSTKFSAYENDRQGSIGCELLRRFKVTINYQDKYIALKPVKKRIKEGFEHDMSGLGIRANGEDFKKYVVNAIESDSPAYNAGLKIGDELVYINNRNTKIMNIGEIVRILTSKEGKEIELFIRRNNELIFCYFTLKRFI